MIELDTLGFDSAGWGSSKVDVHFLPTAPGACAAVCEIVEYLGWLADLVVQVAYSDEGVAGRATSRSDGTFDLLYWSNVTLAGPWPYEIGHLASLPRPPR